MLSLEKNWNVKLPLLFTKEFESRNINKVLNRIYHNKPFGGVWTSPFDVNKGSDWVEWCVSEDFHDWNETSIFTKIHVSSETRMYRIDSMEDLKAIVTSFPLIESLSMEERMMYANFNLEHGIDYEKMKNEFDAIYLSKEGLSTAASPESSISRIKQPSLYGWDCETVFIMNPAIIDGFKFIKYKRCWGKRR